MTRPFHQVIDCPYCGKEITQETAFSRWTRNNPRLDSSAEGLSIMDVDYIIHRYKTHSERGQSRDLQLVMLLEVKTRGGKLTPAQRDTLHMANQIVRNRRQTPTKLLRWQVGNPPLTVVSLIRQKRIALRNYGVHVLCFSGAGPDDSVRIEWDNHEIDVATLESLLRFDLDPDTRQPLDLRRHHLLRSSRQLSLWRSPYDENKR